MVTSTKARVRTSTTLKTTLKGMLAATGAFLLEVILASVPILPLPSAVAAPTSVDLGAASAYSVLGASTVTNTGATVVSNDLGVSPGTAITGFPPGLINGQTHAADPNAAAAQAALATAYTDAAGRTPSAPAVVGVYELGGTTFAPGVYAGASSLGITGTVTLDGGGDPTAVFVFQAGSTLTTASSSTVRLVNGAQSANVFWQIGSSATLGTYSTFAGTIMALASVTVTTGVTVYGRALAQTAAVTLDTDTFVTAAADNTSPSLTITGGATASTTDSTPTISGTSDELGGTVTVTIEVQALTATVQPDGAWSVTAATLADGPHTATASVSDAAGNSASAQQVLTIDATAPTITITGGATVLTADSTPTIVGTSDAVGRTVTVTIAGQTLTAVVQSGGAWSVTAATLADGPHTAAASVSDAAGNGASAQQVLTIDTVAPTVTITGGATASTADSTPTIVGTSDEFGATVTVTIAGQTLTAVVQPDGSWAVTAATLADGPHTAIASVSDAAGNSASAQQVLTIDATAPTITITGGATVLTADSTPTISGTSDELGATVTVTIEGQALTATVQPDGSWSVTAATLADGPHTAIASVSDAAGNSASAQQVLTIDATAPAITITGGATVLTADSTPTIVGASDAVGRTVTVTIAGQTLNAVVQSGGAWSVTAATLADGPHTATASVSDAAGNGASAQQVLTIDATAPTITITGGAAASTTDSTPTISGTSDELGGTVTVTIEGQALTATVQPDGSWSVTAATLADGPHTAMASVSDAAGNSASAQQVLTIDATAPAITITGGAAASTADSTPTIVGTSDAVGRTVTVTIAGQTLTAVVQSGGAWSVTAATLADGPHTAIASVSDAAGNSASAQQVLTIDATAPAITITGGATVLTADSTPTISGTSDAFARTVTVTIAGQTLTAVVQPDGSWAVTAATLADGPHTATASVSDAAGNSASAQQVLTIDATAPTITITGGATVLTADSTPTISGTSDAVGRTVTVTIAGQTLTAVVQSGGAWSVTAATVADGPHTAIASVSDAAGNSATAQQVLTIDTVAPTVTITGGATASTADSTPTIVGTSDELGGTVTVTIAGQTLTATVQPDGSWSVTSATLADGPHTAIASVSDAAGNSASAQQILTTDTVAPTVTIDGGATATTGDLTPLISGTSDAIGRTVTVTVAGQTLTGVVQTDGTWSVSAATLTETAHTITASVTDPAGNLGSVQQVLTVNSTLPVILIAGGASAQTQDATPTISGTTDAPTGSTVTVTVAGQTLTAIVTSGGGWSVTAAALAEGPHTAVASVTDGLGHTGTAQQTLTIDTIGPIYPMSAFVSGPAANPSSASQGLTLVVAADFSRTLAATGAASTVVALVGLGLIAGGAAGLLLFRRRTR
ncbi:MAG: hypothetical protein JWP19_1168 [Rhodoglobus sp.]|nr:hypothetical protein [Rhodoglobus sp.]